MNKLVMIALVAAAPALFANTNPTSVFTTNVATGTASVKIYAPVQLAKIYNLNFGAFVLNDMTHEATVSVDPGDATKRVYDHYSYSQLQNVTPRGTDGCSIGHFDMWRDSSITKVGLLLDKASVTLLDKNTGNSVVFTPQLGTVVPEFSDVYSKVSGTTFEHFNVGGTIKIPAGSVGSFTGSFTVTANYN